MKGHAAVKISDSIIFIYGGYNQLGTCTDTSIMIDVENCVIKNYETRGSKPSPRAFHVIKKTTKQNFLINPVNLLRE